MGRVWHSFRDMRNLDTTPATTATANILSEWAGDILKRSESDVFLACKQGAALLETAWNQADEEQQNSLRPAISAFQNAIERLQRQLEKAGI